MKEIWKDIKGYEGLYQVSNTGKVRSLDRTVIGKNNSKRLIYGKELSKTDNGRGYDKVALQNDGRNTRKICKVHRLVAETFIPNPENKPEVNHINCNKKDNRVSNLEWSTSSENSKHAYDNNLKNVSRSKRVARINDEGKILEIFNSAREASNSYNLTHDGVSAVCRGKRKTCGGMKWKYI